MRIKVTLPALLAERGWRIAFDNAGADAFALEPGGGRGVVMRLVPGRDFNADHVHKAKDRIIEIEAYADSILVGGMSYPLEHEPKRGKPKRASRSRAISRTTAQAKSRAAPNKARRRGARG
jgi:zinc metalloprotease ZmpB